MTCVICRSGEMRPGLATVTLERGTSVVVIPEVPALVCDTCGEYYLEPAVAEVVFEQADSAARRLVAVEGTRYAA